MVAGSGAVVSAQAPVGAPAAPQSAQQQVWPPQQLDDLVAPIAFYPDPLLGQVLAASTYPLEIVEAEQWLQRNSGSTGTLVAFPEVLARMNQDVRWTTDLGNGFLGRGQRSVRFPDTSAIRNTARFAAPAPQSSVRRRVSCRDT
jgi:hypothetical protein